MSVCSLSMLLEFALDLELGWASPSVNPECKCCAQSQLMHAVKAMSLGLECMQASNTWSRAVATQVGTPLLKQVLTLKRRFRGKHSRLELVILAADNMIS